MNSFCLMLKKIFFFFTFNAHHISLALKSVVHALLVRLFAYQDNDVHYLTAFGHIELLPDLLMGLSLAYIHSCLEGGVDQD